MCVYGALLHPKLVTSWRVDFTHRGTQLHSYSGSLQKKEPRIYLRHQRICIWVRASVPCVSSLTTQSKFHDEIRHGYGASSRYLSMCTYGVGAWGSHSACLPHRQWSQCNASLVYVYSYFGVCQISPGTIRTPRRWYRCANISVFWIRKCSHPSIVAVGHSTVKETPVDPFFFVTLGSPYDSYSTSSFFFVFCFFKFLSCRFFACACPLIVDVLSELFYIRDLHYSTYILRVQGGRCFPCLFVCALCHSSLAYFTCLEVSWISSLVVLVIHLTLEVLLL